MILVNQIGDLFASERTAAIRRALKEAESPAWKKSASRNQPRPAQNC